jgi:hypothetical protein
MFQINGIRCLPIVLAAALGMHSLDASALMEAPADRSDTAQAKRDRGAPLGDVMIFDNASGGYDTSAPEKWGRNSWTCQSSTDAATGACPTEPVEGDFGPATVIQLLFKEEKSGATTVLNLYGEKSVRTHSACDGTLRPVPTSWYKVGAIERTQQRSYCVSAISGKRVVVSDNAAVLVKIPAAEIKKLPSGGTWKANLRLNMKQWTGSTAPTIAIFKAAITLDTTDKNNIQVYLPEFASATPTVDLKLHKLANGSRMAGTANVDMCLYDGYNSQSTWFDVSASDGLTVDRRDKGRYSVLLDKDKSGAYESRVDYTVSLTYAGNKIALPNHETVRLQGVNNSAGRLVTLPGIAVPVVCTPTPLTLETPEFQSVWKRPGTYSNKLTITFTPSSASL